MPRGKRLTAQEVLDRQTPESLLADTVKKLAKLYGWRAAHFRPARTAYGWRTAVEGDGKGWPDWVLLRGSRCLIIELKKQLEQPDEHQEAWLAAWGRIPGAEVYVWRPSDIEVIVQVIGSAPDPADVLG